jgi:hypothetical protein
MVRCRNTAPPPPKPPPPLPAQYAHQPPAPRRGMNPPNGYTWLGENYFKDRAQLVHSLNKPSE